MKAHCLSNLLTARQSGRLSRLLMVSDVFVVCFWLIVASARDGINLLVFILKLRNEAQLIIH